MLQGRFKAFRSRLARRGNPPHRAIVLLGLLVSVGVGSSAALYGQTTTPSTQPAPTGGIPTITFNLEDRSTTGVLPFDEPFRIKALKVGEKTVAVRVRFVPLPPGTECTGTLETLKKKKALKGILIKTPATSTAPATAEWHALAKDEFVVPNKLQCFAFELDQTLPEDLRKLKRAMLEQSANRITTEAAIAGEVKSIREQYCAALKEFAAEKNMELKVPCDSVGQSANASASLSDFAKVLDAIDNTRSQMDTYCQVRAVAVASLSALQKSQGSFSQILEAMHQARRKPAIRALITERAAAFRELRGDLRSKKLLKDEDCVVDSSQRARAEGLLELTTPAELEGHEEELDGIIAELESMKAMFESLLANDAKLVTELGEDTNDVLDDTDRLAGVTDEFRRAKGHLAEVKTLLTARETALDRVAAGDELLKSETVTLVGTSVVPYGDRAKLYISADIGLGSAWEIQETFGYAGVNVYTRAINKNATLDWKPGELDWWRKRVSGMVGVTVQDVERAGEFKGTLGKKAVVAAIGFRILESVRISAGGVLIKRVHPNPLVDDPEMRMTPFVSFSIDFDVKSTLGGLATVLGGS